MAERKAVTRQMATRYSKATKTLKGQMLDELCEPTSWTRRHARRELAKAVPDAITVAMIGGLATVIVGFLGYFGLRITRGLDGVSSRIDRVEAKIDRLGETHADTRERIARLEERETHLWKPAGLEP